MSEEQTPPPVSTKSASQMPKPPVKTLEKVTQTLQQTWIKIQPVLKTQSIKTLKGTIEILQGVTKKLEAESTPVLPLVETPSPSVSTDSTPSVSVEVVAPEVTPEVTSEIPITQSSAQVVTIKPSFWEKLTPIWQQLKIWFPMVLQKVRSLLPESVNQKLPDWGLSGAIAGIMILILWITTGIIFPSKPVVVATKPPAVVSVPSETINIPPAAIPTDTKEVVETPPESISASPELVASQTPEIVEIKPTPKPVLTPEQKLIASIQNQVDEITKGYAEGLIKSIEVNFERSLLVVKVGEDWYKFEASQQDKVADEMQSRAKDLDFSKLEIMDSEGILIARSPVVGENMIILKRQS